MAPVPGRHRQLPTDTRKGAFSAPKEEILADSLRAAAEEALARLADSFVYRKLGICYDYFCPPESLPSPMLPHPKDVRQGLPNPMGLGSGMADCALNNALLCDAYALRAEYARHGIEVLEIFHGVPAWMGPSKRSPLPQDFSRLAADFATMPPELAATCRAFEAWNEPDLLRLPADQYATVVRALAYALRRALPRVTLATGVFATAAPGAFAEGCAVDMFPRTAHVETVVLLTKNT